ncbi:MAG: isoleucine--tRNA ligase [Candidatus Cloacimonadaceae bacterium]|jgi:isoleucyl-tRNA synthetase|nr:isoleucine--tRNA ligase [Candidatus Cloacimonadota bacterium]MDX9949980.1 isoleucine--tRNA ligase [Candidatus Syntrophosphaera sp.]NLN85630.1 isoleucine--tRNA ligase [Candidatus Cloacimonadota bacterium]
MFKNIDLKESPRHLEERIRAYWKERELAQKSIDFREGAPRFIFYEGPPTANGRPGIHHVISRTLKDLVCRYKTMTGHQVKRKAGWDTHGLPVEIEVEKQLGLEDKKAIEEYGIEKFCLACKESVWSYLDQWREMTELMGYWIDLDDPYVTLTNDYIESVWHILNDFFRRDLIYKAHKIVPYCPSCGTPLSSHEVAQGYRDVEDPSVFVKFKALDEEDTWYLAWTTTPWTLISNVALAVHPDETYVKVRHQDENLILAKARLEVLDGEAEILAEFTGRDLEKRRYEPLFNFIKVDKPAWIIGLADYVSMDDGTGIVHTAPAFGQDDYSLGMKYDLPFIQPVDAEGKFLPEVTPWAGVFVKHADKDIIRSLRDEGKLYRREQMKHSYPHCWRCENPLIYYARESWYIRTTKFKEKLLENNRQINWYPPFVGEKRFGEWLENNVDWALSRDRFWGTPLNIWVCGDCGDKTSVGSISELREKGRLADGSTVPEDIELHRPYIDDVSLPCAKCGGSMNRTPEVIDCWFDSGAMPFAQWHYPFENKECFESELFPADFICEAIDQTRGWFYSMLTISTLYKGVSSYKSCLVNDLILDKTGQKMSKSKGNTVDPIELMHDFGADAIRWYMVEVSPPWVPTRFDVDGVREVIGKFIGTLKNTYSFFAIYANIDGFDISKYPRDWTRSAEIDRWIVSRLQSLTAQVRAWMEEYELTRVVRAIQDFVIDELSNWYVRRSRRRFWAMELTEDKIDAYRTLYQVLETVAKLIAPFVPHLAEELFLSLGAGESVHLADYPEADPAFIDQKLEEEMRVIIDLVYLGRAARNACQIKVRQPLQKMYVPAKHKATVQRMAGLLQEEVNIHEIVYVAEDDDFVHYELKPQFKVMGPKYGSQMKAIAAELAKLKGQEVLSAFNATGSYRLEPLGLDLVPEDVAVHIQPREGFVFESLKDTFVALDTTLSPELLREGLARELVNKIQFSRKEQGFEIMDRIRVSWKGDADIAAALAEHGDFIKSETLCDELLENPDIQGVQPVDINGKEVFLKIERLA